MEYEPHSIGYVAVSFLVALVLSVLTCIASSLFCSMLRDVATSEGWRGWRCDAVCVVVWALAVTLLLLVVPMAIEDYWGSLRIDR